MEHYLAGYFDGEGCIHINKSNYALWATVSGVKRDVLDMFQARFGGVVKNYRTYYHWTVACKKAEAFLEVIHPYLILKKKEALLGLEYRDVCFGKNKDISKREEYRVKMRKLKRG